MLNVTNVRKLGLFARVAARQVGRTRTFSAVLSAARTAAGHWARVLHQLWLEVTGFVFLALGAIGATAFIRELARYQAGKIPATRVIVATVFTLTFVWFGLTSFWRVRKKQ